MGGGRVVVCLFGWVVGWLGVCVCVWGGGSIHYDHTALKTVKNILANT